MSNRFCFAPLESKQGLPGYFANPRNLMSSSAARSDGKSSCLVLVMHEIDGRPRAGVRTLWGRYVAWPTFHKGRKALEDLTPEEGG